MQVAFVPPRLDAPRQARVVSVEMLDDRSAAVHFDSVLDRATAELLCGCSVLVRRDDVPDEAFAEADDFEGFAVVDARFGELGTVSGMMENPAHPILLVDACGGKDGRILIPWVGEFIEEVDERSAVIRTAIPAGLLEL